MGYPGRHNIYEAIIRRMVAEALEEEEKRFTAEHGADTEEALQEYLREWARKLQHSPRCGEIAGSSLFRERFGSWERSLIIAGLPPAENMPETQAFARVRAEEARQKEVYRLRKAEKKALAQKRRVMQAAKKENKP